MAETSSFWPPLKDVGISTSPRVLLRQQADLLATQTNGVLRGEVEDGSHGEWITADLFVVASRINDYRYHLVKVRYRPPDLFSPVQLIDSDKSVVEVDGEMHYEQAVKRLLGSDQTRKVISELYALSQGKAVMMA